MTPRTRTLLVLAAIVVVGLLAFDQLARMDRRFFGDSAPAARALIHYLAADYAGAARFYREHLRRWSARIPPEDAWSWTALAAGDLDRAEVEARTESRLAPTDPEPLLTLAEVALARRDPMARTLAGRVLALRRDDYDALLIMAVAHAREGAHHAAIDDLKRALRYDRVERRSTVFLAVLEATGELDDRKKEEQPACLLAHLHRYLRIYDPSHARPTVRYAERAIAAGDRADDAHVTIGLVHTREGRRTAAFAAFQHALGVNPRNTAALLWTARYRSDRGELTEEFLALRTAVDVDPDDRFVATTFHDFLVRKLGDYRQAQATAEAAIARNDRDADSWWRLGNVQSHLGHHGHALHSYRQAAARAPDTPHIEASIADTLAELDRDAEAVVAYRRAIALDPFRPEPHLGLGLLHGRARRWAAAIEEYEAVARLGGGLSAGLCEMYLEVGRPDDAGRCAVAVLASQPDNEQALVLLPQAQAARSASR
jgi:tetratricopeptide (TPR) repeat protein